MMLKNLDLNACDEIGVVGSNYQDFANFVLRGTDNMHNRYKRHAQAVFCIWLIIRRRRK